MAGESTEQDKSESATPFKLDKARQRGMLARGMDLGFVSTLVAVAIIAQASGPDIVRSVALAMQRIIVYGTARADDPRQVVAIVGRQIATVAGTLLVPFFILVALAITVEVIQNRGVVFSAQPLKPDFTRLNPATGLKRLFSLRMLKELAKNVVKLTLYGTAAYLFIRNFVTEHKLAATDGRQLSTLIIQSSGGLLLLFIVLAAFVALLDQLLARREFSKQMRMSRREITREVREREGEPRQKRKRKQILAEILKQAAAAANVKGADVLIVNPTHYAVALRYRAEAGDAPVVQARGRNFWAQRMRRAAERDGVTIIRHPTLARALYREGEVGRMIGPRHFVAVADIYIALRRAMQKAG